MNRDIIKPRTLSGFRDFLPQAMMPREWLIDTARKVYRSYGYAPIDTPALEYFEILAGKGSEETDRQMYSFHDHGDRHVGLRFDLTVPLARFVAQHIEQIGTPFKRYQIGSVWRGERAQAGRYREFVQCDFDTIGTTSIASDVEATLVIHDLLSALGFDHFSVRINNRKVLNGLLQKFDLTTRSSQILRAVDKLQKAGRAKVVEELAITGVDESQIQQILQLVEISGSNQQILTQLIPLVRGNELAEEGWNELCQLNQTIEATGAPLHRIQIDPSIARGLDYYTGVVFETILDKDPAIGSVCSGGRYDNLAELYTVRNLPGIGASLGLDRLLAAMERLEMVPAVSTPADVLIVNFDENLLSEYLNLARSLRSSGIGVELYCENKRLGQQFKYADRRGFGACIVVGDNEIEEKIVQVKWMKSGKQVEISVADGFVSLINQLKTMLKIGN